MITFLLRDDQDEHPVDLPGLQILGERALGRLRAEPGTYSAVCLPEEAIIEVNRRHFGHDRSTDVMAFPLEPGDVPGDDLCGEILLCPAQAHRQAQDLALDFDEEMGRLLMHGILHLMGWEDDTEKKRRAMLERGEELLKDLA